MNSSFQKSILPNGLRIVSEHVPHVRSVSMGVWIEVGSRDESPQANGIFHFIEHMLFKGTLHRSARQIAESLESVGGALNGFTSREQTCYQARILDEHVPLAVDVLSDLILRPLLDPEEVEREKRVVADEIRDLMDSPSEYIDERLAALVWRGNKLGMPISGSLESLQHFSASQLRRHIKNWYRPERMVVAAAGNLRHQKLVKEVKKAFRFPARRMAPVRRTRVLRKAGQLEIVSRRVMQLHVCLGCPAYSYADPRKYALFVLNAILGEGMSSRLFQNLRERQGLAYDIHSYLGMLRDTGLFAVYLATEPGKGRKALRSVLQELSLLREVSLPEEELEHAKVQLKGRLMLGLESMSARMMRLAQQEILLGTPVSLDETKARIDAVTAQEVRQIAGQLLPRRRLSLVAIGPVRHNFFQLSHLQESR